MASRHKRHHCRYRIDTCASQLCHCDGRHKSVTRMLLTGIVADVSALEAGTARQRRHVCLLLAWYVSGPGVSIEWMGVRRGRRQWIVGRGGGPWAGRLLCGVRCLCLGGEMGRRRRADMGRKYLLRILLQIPSPALVVSRKFSRGGGRGVKRGMIACAERTQARAQAGNCNLGRAQRTFDFPDLPSTTLQQPSSDCTMGVV